MALTTEIIRFGSRTEMACTIADEIAGDLISKINENTDVTIAFSGGSTPKALYEALSQTPLDWQKVTGVLLDERFVPPDRDGSNERFIRATLQQGQAVDMTLLGLWQGDTTLEDAAALACKRVDDLSQPIDVVVMGMGEDGHTASWFPYAEGLDVALDPEGPAVTSLIAKKSNVTGAHVERLTLTLGLVSKARRIILMITGEAKLKTLEHAIKRGPVEEMPVRAILWARPDVKIYWSP